MHGYFRRFWNNVRQGDWILLLLCMVASAVGCLVIASATNYMGSTRYIIMQAGASVIGILLYVFISTVNLEVFSEHRVFLVLFNLGMLFLLVPFGETINGNRSWINLPILPFNIQAAEVCKIAFILVLASVMNANQRQISKPKTIVKLLFHLGLIMIVNLVISGDMGVSLIFLLIFIGMTFGGGIHLGWFAAAGVLLLIFGPPFYKYVLGDYQRLRIEVIINPDLDPLGIGPRYHTVQSLKTLTGGGLTGQGLFQGHRTQTDGTLFARHTDYVFSSIGEELGYAGCLFVLVLLAAIVARCIWVGMRSPDYMRKLVCFGAASALIFQIVTNVGMCMGLVPVIGLTLPFISYGGSSVVTTYLMLGLVSGVYARPRPISHERYIRPPYIVHPYQ